MEESAVLQSEEEISLIDILWRQDIDLGVEREVFDIHFQEREEDARKARKQEEEKRKQEKELERIILTLGKLDKETGEVLPHSLSQIFQGADDSTTLDPYTELMALLPRQTPPHSLVSPGNVHSTPSSQGSPVTQNPLLSALLFSKKLPAEEEKASIEVLPLPDLQPYLDLLEAHVPESPCELLEENTETAMVSGPHPLLNVHSGPAETIQTYTCAISDTSEGSPPLEQILPESTELEQTFSEPKDLTESFLDTIMRASPPDNLNQMSLGQCELRHNQNCLHIQTEMHPEHANTTAPEHSLCQHKLIPNDSSYVTDDMILFSLESSRVPIDLDMSLYGEFSTSQSEDSVCVQSDHKELLDVPVLSELVDLQSPLFPPSETDISLQQSTQDDSPPKTVSDQSEHSTEVNHMSPSFETAFQSQQGHHSWSLCRDEQRAQTLNLPLSVEDITSMSVDAFNEAISTHKLSERQLSLMRDIRRRGKNKIAAQSCRKRKLDSLVDLQAEVEALREESQRRLSERERNAAALCETREKLSKLYDKVFSKLRDEHGNPYSSKEYKLQYSTDGQVFLLPSTPHMKKRTGVHATVTHEGEDLSAAM
ncbi:nuclear factor erythroid 2-related factor 2b isoform X1 [Pygocentrus nattereri]|uniref:BZIP domain-containing protein n=2 Tax=Pygocentrus nattereri TaxID=42514 RepID=A0A3B4DWL9_PYGNA|nr:nuclear factor erythroid 2-related factor 2b isoform X1 [Pygocentrus nattereri]